MKTENYLTDNFSIEYDTYMTEGAYGLRIFMQDPTGENEMNVHVTAEGAQWTYSNTKSLNGTNPAAIQYGNYYNKWHHIALAYKNDQLKVYVDQYRVLTVPHCGMKPAKIDCAGIGNQDNPIIFKDLKIADGARIIPSSLKI